MPRSRHGKRSLARKLTLAALSFVSALFLAEIVLRFFPCPISPVRQIFTFTDDDRVYTLMPGAALRFEGVVERLDPAIEWRINAQGLRDDRVFGPNTTAARRIATYGDSDTFGWSVDLNDTFQKRMERLDPGLEIMNFGVPGYNISNIARYLEKTLPLYRPDVVVYLVHPNDFEPPLRFLNSVTLNSELARRLAYSYHRILLAKDHKQLHRTSDRINDFTVCLKRILKACVEHQCDCILAFGNGNDVVVLEKDEELRNYFLSADHRRVIDLSPTVAAYRLVDGHLSKEAHAMLAELLIYDLRDNSDVTVSMQQRER